jgi:hypothetical protein
MERARAKNPELSCRDTQQEQCDERTGQATCSRKDDHV